MNLTYDIQKCQHVLLNSLPAMKFDDCVVDGQRQFQKFGRILPESRFRDWLFPFDGLRFT